MKRGRKPSTVYGMLRAVVDDVDYLLASGYKGKEVRLDMTDWVVEGKQTCSVCLAGAYLLNSEGIPSELVNEYGLWWNKYLSPEAKSIADGFNRVRHLDFYSLIEALYERNSRSVYLLEAVYNAVVVKLGYDETYLEDKVTKRTWKKARQRLLKIAEAAEPHERKIRRTLGLTHAYTSTV